MFQNKIALPRFLFLLFTFFRRKGTLSSRVVNKASIWSILYSYSYYYLNLKRPMVLFNISKMKSIRYKQYVCNESPIASSLQLTNETNKNCMNNKLRLCMVRFRWNSPIQRLFIWVLQVWIITNSNIIQRPWKRNLPIFWTIVDRSRFYVCFIQIRNTYVECFLVSLCLAPFLLLWNQFERLL